MNVCDVLSESPAAKSGIRKMIDKTFYTHKKETFGVLCLHGDVISVENIGVGEYEYIANEKTGRGGCSGNGIKIAEIHTHPSRSVEMSDSDMLYALRQKLDTVCIGVEVGKPHNYEVGCHTLKESYKSKSRHADELKQRIEAIVPKIRAASDKAFKASYKNPKLAEEAYREEKRLQREYWIMRDEMKLLIEEMPQWFDNCKANIS